MDEDAARARWNGCRWRADDARGHYESWFLRANAPDRALAFWVRYTIFAPREGAPVGELWAIVFDGERDRVRAAKQVVPIERCRFDAHALAVELGDARLDARALSGRADGIAWTLAYEGGAAPLLLLPERLYAGGFPKAKALVPAPLCRFTGELALDDERIAIDGWLGSQNHNWGARHTDRYAWGQVAGFDGRDDAFLECSTAKLKLGPLWTPWLTVAVLRVGAREYAFNSLLRAGFARAELDGLGWRFETGNGRERLRVAIEAPRAAFVGLRYANPPGGAKICLNSKIARATVELDDGAGPPLQLATANRAAFELLGDDARGIDVVA